MNPDLTARQTVARVRAALNDPSSEGDRVAAHRALLSWHLRAAVLELDASGIVAANDHALAMLGCTTAAGASDIVRTACEGIDACLAGLEAAGSTSSVPLRVDEGLASERVLRLDALRLAGDAPRFIGLLTDPSNAEALEADVMLAGQLRELARAYRTIAHELRAPLSALLINVEILQDSLVTPEEKADGQTREKRIACAKVLKQEITRLNRSLHDLLTDAGSRIERVESFDLRTVVNDLAMLIGEQARRQGVDITVGLPVDAPILLGHRDRLKEAFLNIVVNSLQAMPDGGRLVIHVEIERWRARVVFRDSGAGIPPAIAARLNDLQASSKSGGSGIGLYVARRLVELNGGVLLIRTEQRGGAIIEIELPLAPGVS